MPHSDRLRIVLIEPAAHPLPGLAPALLAEPRLELTPLDLQPGRLAEQLLERPAGVAVVYLPICGELEAAEIERAVGAGGAVLLLSISEWPASRPVQSGRLEHIQLRVPGNRQAELQAAVEAVLRLGGRARVHGRPSAPAMARPAGTMLPGEAALARRLIAVGASTGGTEAMAKLFRLLPVQLPGIVVVQHMPPVFTRMYAERLDEELPFSVREVSGEALIEPGSIHIAPGGRHLLVERRKDRFYTRLGDTEKVGGHCPSVDVLFRSVAAAAGPSAIGLLLTGMGADGAAGLVEMRQAGAYTIGQSERSCVVYGMPCKAYELGGVEQQADLEDMPQLLLDRLAKPGP
ncbi:MAG: chemotaxis protein CheB [Clostridiales bacterium]|nr:chemotaxis protein CheB [Clostridiales bacterium]